PAALLARGLIALPAGPNVIRLLPPLVITQEQLDAAIDTIEAVLSQPNAGEPRTEQPATSQSSPPKSHPSPQSPVLGPQSSLLSPEASLLQGMLTIPSYSVQKGALASYLVEQAEQMGL